VFVLETKSTVFVGQYLASGQAARRLAPRWAGGFARSRFRVILSWTCRILDALSAAETETCMDIKGPLKVGVVEPSPEGNYELHIDFTEAFKAADLSAQDAQFRAYIAELGRALKGDIDGRNAQGILLVQQICEQLQPHIATGDIALGETLVIEVQRTPGVNLVDLLHG